MILVSVAVIALLAVYGLQQVFRLLGHLALKVYVRHLTKEQ